MALDDPYSDEHEAEDQVLSTVRRLLIGLLLALVLIAFIIAGLVVSFSARADSATIRAQCENGFCIIRESDLIALAIAGIRPDCKPTPQSRQM